MKWNGEQFLSQVNRDLVKKLHRAGMYSVSTMRRKLNTAQKYTRGTGQHGVYYHGLDPSSPGDYPKKLSGQLVKSLAYSVEGLSMVVGSALAHANYLQQGTRRMLPRPWLSLWWAAEMKNVVGKILAK